MLLLRYPRMVQSSFAAALICGGSILFSPAAGAEWPQWRGPHADGSVAGPIRQGDLPDKLPVLWQSRVGGGYSGPVVSGDRVWVHSRQGNEEVVSCLRLSTGEPIWQKSYSAPFRQDVSAVQHGLGPYATPVLSGGRLFTLGITSVVIAWDAATGDLLWRKDSADEFDPSFPYFGTAGSPVVWRDRVFVHLGGHDRSLREPASRGPMVALRVSDGTEIWRWTGDGPAIGATPVLTEVEGQAQLVFKTAKMMIGTDPNTGRELWQIPFVVLEDNTISTPLIVDGRLITSDFDRGIEAWKIERHDSGWSIRQLWKQRDASISMSSPVVAGDLVVGFSHLKRGQLFLVDPESGEVYWQGPGRSGEHASLVSWGDEVMAFLDDGTLIVGRVESRRFHQLARYRLGESVGWAHPAVDDSRIVYRDGYELAVVLLNQH